MNKIGVIGDASSVLCFMTVGFSVATVENAEGAKAELVRMAKEDYAVIYIVEDMALQITDTIEKYKDTPKPAVIVIPGVKGTNGYGINSIKKSVERAVGADILFKD